jgi:CubicO group peptidase (beta-lactamase class C family)
MRRSTLAFWLSSFSIIVAQDPQQGSTSAGVLAAQFAARLDVLCQPLVDAEVAVGFVVGIVDGDASLVRGYGRVDPSSDRAPDAATVYEIGSISKVFTGLLLADAITRGEVAADDRVQKWLPAGITLPRTEVNEVLLWHLSAHVSGLPRLPDGESPDPQNPYAHMDRVAVYAAASKSLLRNEPGSTYEYSNLAAGLLGQLLVDRAGVASFEALLAQRVTGPLSMADTVVELTPVLRERFAPPFAADLASDHEWDLAALAGAGGIRSTMRDMLAFASAQCSTPADAGLAKSIARSHEKQKELPGGAGIALGWHLARGGAVLWHNGETGGFHSYLAVQPGKARAICILCNTATATVDALGERVLMLLGGGEPKPLKLERPVAVDRETLQRYVGVYEVKDGVAMAVTVRERGLYAQISGQPSLRLFARSETEFFYRQVQATVAFQVDGGACSGLELRQGGSASTWKKLAQRMR